MLWTKDSLKQINVTISAPFGESKIKSLLVFTVYYCTFCEALAFELKLKEMRKRKLLTHSAPAV